MKSIKISITGYIQGVGFRPYIYNLAINQNITGYVYNEDGIVTIIAQGNQNKLQGFCDSIQASPPANCKIFNIYIKEISHKKISTFNILNSKTSVRKSIPFISPDIALCANCEKELSSQGNHRYLYPFTNCTNCGPRYSIINNIPYDRSNTTMLDFPMCSNCIDEYSTPTNYRFHAQTNCCPTCGPEISIYNATSKSINDIINYFTASILKGEIWSIKGLGGFHLCCDAYNFTVISKLRFRKNRPKKPFAIMFRDINEVLLHCHLNDTEYKLLTSSISPIVLLKKRINSTLPLNIAPDNKYIGVMLPYTPMHFILFNNNIRALIMTSGNLTSLPIEYTNQSAINNLSKYSDHILLHNRTIENSIDDSVTKVLFDKARIIRLGRGYCPLVTNIKNNENILALGSNEKNTISIGTKDLTVTSPHIGNLDNYEMVKYFEKYLIKFISLYSFTPEIVAIDMHPSFPYIDIAKNFNCKIKTCQHHHSHIASCLVDNNYFCDKPVLGIAFDGTGYGDDGHIWGSEFLISTFKNYKRAAHLDYIRLSSGDDIIKSPQKIALCYLNNIKQNFPTLYDELNIDLIINKLYNSESLIYYKFLDQKKDFIKTSSMGRLFDCVASLIGLCNVSTFEGEAAIMLENILNSERLIKGYNYSLSTSSGICKISTLDIIIEVIKDIINNIPVYEISLKFHSTIVDIVVKIAEKICHENNLDTIALTGGVFTNSFILRNSVLKLESLGFQVLIHESIPNNDGGISIGQIAIASSNT